MKNKTILIVSLVIVVLLVSITIYVSEEKQRTIDNCKKALTEYKINLIYDGKPLEGEYYWINTLDNWASTERISDNKIEIQIIDETDSLKDSSLKIVKLNRTSSMNHNEIYDLNYALNNDPRYERGKSEINRNRIEESIRQYSINSPEYYEIKDFFTNNPLTSNEITIDLKSKQIISTSSEEKTDLWLYCEF